jgi:IMP cyclohydrolase
MSVKATNDSLPTVSGALAANAYPGRVLVLARCLDGQLAAAYALTGRSTASRERRLTLSPSGEVEVVSTETAGHDPLRHYTARTVSAQHTVLGNGAQVGTVAHRLAQGWPPLAALDDLEYEPDPPIWTPRITAVTDRRTGRCWLGAARRSQGERTGTDVTVTALGDLAAGDAVLLSTYESDGSTIRSSRAHLDLRTPATDAAHLLAEVWSGLDPRFRIAAVAVDPVAGTSGPTRHATDPGDDR